MKRKFIVLVSLSVVSMMLLVACGGGGSASPIDVQAQVTEAPAQAVDAPAGSQFFLEIASIKGLVEARANTDEAYAPVEVGQRLFEGAQIRTGADGIVALYRDAITMAIVDNNSEVQIKTLGGSVDVPITIISLFSGAAALEHHAEKLPDGAVFSIETPEGNEGRILGSTVRVQYNPETKLMTATCLTGTCTFVRGDQTLTLEQGQAVDVEGLQPPPGAPEEMTVEQANQFLAMGTQLCGCEIKISDIRDGGLSQTAPAPEDLGSENGASATEAPATEAPATEVPAAEPPAATEAPSSDSGSDS